MIIYRQKIDLPPSAKRAWHLQILLQTPSAYACLVVGSLGVFLQAVPAWWKLVAFDFTFLCTEKVVLKVTDLN